MKQKGSGNARRGDKKAALLRGGGRCHGPRPRDYILKVNKKVTRLARKSAFTQKRQAGHLWVVEDFSFDKPATQDYLRFLRGFSSATERSLLVFAGAIERNLFLSVRNLPKAQVTTVEELNTHAIVATKQLLLTEGAVKQIEAKLA